MAVIEEFKLYETYIFTSDTPSRVKYEIYKGSRKLIAFVTIYRISPIGVQSYDSIDLQSPVNHPEFAFKEVRTHFENNYA
ncbi:DNA gyrase subunit B [Serratia ureilytica]|uniref:DNA gyrase subunit B n=1 Tax=Serratia ureilytica TaxID=300181 RepID=UPI001CBDE7ED|nr:DNA gyrase subunit B [Serratia ureilytica]UAN25214.1 DNA gyrase subunit B [Serratia ureilytica]